MKGQFFIIGLMAGCGLDAVGTLQLQADGGAPSGGADASTADAARGVDAANGVPDAAVDSGPYATRARSGLIALYELEEGAGAVVSDRSGVAPALDLSLVAGAGATRWVRGGLAFDSSAVATSSGPATKVRTRCQATQALTLEAWVSFGTLPTFSHRIVTLTSASTTATETNNAVMMANPTTVDFLLRVNGTVAWRTSTPTGGAIPQGVLTHLAMTRDASSMKIYFNGKLTDSFVATGDFAAWDDGYPLTVGNTTQQDRAWIGEIHLVAIYDRALTEAEVRQNLAAGADP